MHIQGTFYDWFILMSFDALCYKISGVKIFNQTFIMERTYAKRGERIQAITFWTIATLKKNILQFIFLLLLTQDHMVLEISKCFVFHPISAKLLMAMALATMVGYRLRLFLAISQVLKMLWHFEILTWESMGKL